MSGTDGRLDLDDLGEVIESASTLDGGRDSDVLAGVEGRTWGERFEAAGITPWVRRHRAALATVTAVVAVAAATGFVYEQRRIPDDDGAVNVAVIDFVTPSGGTMDFAAPGLITASYTLVPTKGEETAALLGISGPGIRASSAYGRSANALGDRPLWTVSAVLGCEDPGALDAKPEDYRLLVRRTDRYGRAAQGSIALPAGTQSPWDQQVASSCLSAQSLEWLHVVSATPSLGSDGRSVVLALTLRNQMSTAVVVSSQGSPLSSVRALPASTSVPAGGTGVLEVPERVNDCNGPGLDGVGIQAPGSNNDVQVDRGMSLDLATDAVLSNHVSWPAVWSSAEQARIQAMLLRVCAGVPPTTTRVVSAGPAPASVIASTVPLDGSADAVVVRTVLDVATAATTVLATDMVMPQDVEQGSAVQVHSGPAVPTTAGHARIVVDWTGTCDGWWTPPVVQLHLTAHGREYAVVARIDEPTTAKAFLAQCPDLTMLDLANNGWVGLGAGNASPGSPAG